MHFSDAKSCRKDLRWRWRLCVECAWAGALSDPLGAPVPSPSGRYLQWRVKLKANGATSPSLRRVEVAHLETNRPPSIVSLSLSPDEPSFSGGEKHGGVTQTLSNGIEIDYSMPIGAVQAAAPNDVPPALRHVVTERSPFGPDRRPPQSDHMPTFR